MESKVKLKKSPKPKASIPSPCNWRTTDEGEINHRRERDRNELFKISNLTPRNPVFSIFKAHSGSGLKYSVEIRDVKNRQFYCDCVDFRINGLGTFKHVEAVRQHIQRCFLQLFLTLKKRARQELNWFPMPPTTQSEA